ncbi:MAG: 3-hydroxyacyl-CoA dehydrogenase family protein [Gemmatimonadota bacterium]
MSDDAGPGAPAPPEIRTVAVLGAGTMGHGIAQVCAQAGLDVRLHDPDPHALEGGLDRIRANLDKGVELGKVEAEERRRALERLAPAAELDDAVGRADAVVEAAPEKLELKRAIFREVEAATPDDALLATNTSSISVAAIGQALERPERFLGLHFFNPVHIMGLVEVVWSADTREARLEQAISLVRRLGKEPVVVRDSPGFASSRLGVILALEAIRMLEEEVASAQDIDRAMELGYRHPMGPLRLTDLIGLDVRLGIAEYLHEALRSEAFRPPQLLRRMVEEGRTGRKAGRGFYDWSDDG